MEESVIWTLLVLDRYLEAYRELPQDRRRRLSILKCVYFAPLVRAQPY